MAKIIGLKVSNVKRLRAVELRPDGGLVVIAGKNEQGKTSLLDSIAYALGGKSLVPAEPVRKGERRARIEVQIDDPPLRVVRTFDAAGGSKLTITDTDADGEKKRSPQAILDALVGKLCFDPLAYGRLDPPKQAAILRELAGVDTTILDRKRAELFAERTEQNREAKRLRARLDAAPHHDDAPDAEVSVVDLAAQLEQAAETKRSNDDVRASVPKAREAHEDAKRELAECDRIIAELEQRLVAARENREHRAADVRARLTELRTAEEKVAALVDPDTAPIREAMSRAEETNRKVRENAARKALAAEHATAERRSQELSDAIEGIDAQKREMLESASFPVPGLGFDEDGVTYQGVPLEQASGAERLRVSVAMAVAMNPRLRVLLVRDGSLLDDDSMALLAHLAEEHSVQLWMERVGDRDPGAIVIEDGVVRGSEEEDAAE